MAKMILENTTRHIIVLHVAGEPVKTVTIPQATLDDDGKLVHGVASVDGDLVAAARKASKIVNQYFRDGHLREVKSATEEPKAA